MTDLLEGFTVHRTGSESPEAPLVVLVHGLGGAASSWDPLAPLLAPDHRVVALDLPGHGTSPAVEHDAMIPPALGARLHRLATTLAAKSGAPVHLVGHSLGGWICLEAAAEPGAHTSIGSVTAFTPAGLWTTPRRRPPLLPTGQQFARLLGRLPDELVTTRIGRTLALGATSTAPRRLPAEVVRTAVRSVAAASGYAGADAGIASATFTRGDEVKVPVTVVAGLRDRVLPRTFLVRACAPPQTTWLEWQDCGHVPVWDRPADCAAVVRAQVAGA